ncbi:SDR family oxidoreductase [Agaribacterium haliotis]|uniref:SDR family oxidoreductase n=1 Tax=Agaribacterium haliotis TaxID=2013869 RepID=UPI000BB57BBA|nr:SDR family oxidoreductase [Agaribacterium haliotis]
MDRILLAGASGYLGSHIARELQKRALYYRVVLRNCAKVEQLQLRPSDVIEAELTEAQSIAGCCDGIDVVISCVGITRQKDGLSYMQVDYMANLNLLREAERAGVKKFIYVSALNGEKLKQLKIFQAKEAFVEALQGSDIQHCVIRPNGFFSDMEEFFAMAKRGRVYLFGDGEYKSNPIHGADLAELCVDALSGTEKNINIGGPGIMSQNEVARLAFEALGKPVRISHLPDWLRRLILFLSRSLLSSKNYGPIEFFLTVLAMDMLAPCYGKHSLAQHYRDLAAQNSSETEEKAEIKH